MMDSSKKPTTVDEYIAACPKEVQPLLETLRRTIHEAAPQAEEIISYGMPTFRQKRNLVYFGASKKHIGFYPTAEPIEAFREAAAEYVTGKGTLQFPYSQPLPLDLVTKIVQYRVEQVSK